MRCPASILPQGSGRGRLPRGPRQVSGYWKPLGTLQESGSGSLRSPGMQELTKRVPRPQHLVVFLSVATSELVEKNFSLEFHLSMHATTDIYNPVPICFLRCSLTVLPRLVLNFWAKVIISMPHHALLKAMCVCMYARARVTRQALYH